MRKILAIILCKILRIIGKMVGKGSSLPGKFALKICPDVLSRVGLPENIVAVTGSNGKTSTVEMMAHILRENGKKVIYNAEGSNQIEGVTTFILANASILGKVKGDVLLIESDERYAKHTFKYLTPTYYVITNLYRDQLTRNGHPMWVYGAIKDSIKDGSRLVLNADDPLVSLFGVGKEDTIYFGADKLSTDSETFTSVYNDGVYCPVCHAPMSYDTYHYNHIGHYNCDVCGYKRQNTAYSVTEANLDEGYLVINGKDKIIHPKKVYDSTVWAIFWCGVRCRRKIEYFFSDILINSFVLAIASRQLIEAIKLLYKFGFFLAKRSNKKIKCNKKNQTSV